MKTQAKIICDSISPEGVRLTTFELDFHRFILAELNTHRAFSRNSASSRAIPVAKTLSRVENDPAMPVYWGANQSGMQAAVELEENSKIKAQTEWVKAANDMVVRAENFRDIGLHKQIANRILEPWIWHKAVVTAVDFDNFFWQRCDPDAQPEMKTLADAMQLEYYTHEPASLKIGEWHLPYIDAEATHKIDATINERRRFGDLGEENYYSLAKKISTARCARTSYMTQDGKHDISEDLSLYDRLDGKMHVSPFEHQATPCPEYAYIREMNKNTSDGLQLVCKYAGNFGIGWHQHRKGIENENRTNFVPNHPLLLNKEAQS